MIKKRRLRTYGFGNPPGVKPQPNPTSSSSPMGMAAEFSPGAANSPYYSPENLNTIAAPQQQGGGSWFDRNQGTIAAVGTAVGTGIEAAAGPMKDTEYTQELNKRKQLTKTIGGAASAINPLIGAGVAIGSGIGAQTVDEWGRYKSTAGNAVDEAVNPVTGVGGVMRALKGKQSGSGFLNKLTIGLVGKSDNQKEAEEGKRKFEAERVKTIKQRSQQTLANYGTTGNQYYAKYGMKFPVFPAGGMLPYPTDGSEVNQLSSNMAQYEGSTHANGGIELDTNQDQQPDIEVEGTEVIKDNMVYSNRLRPSKDVKNIVRDSGVSVRKGDTYATLSARVGKKKGKFEDQLESTRPGEKNSAQLMQARLDETANLLFMDQQVRKFKKDTNNKYLNGGKFPNGGRVPPKRKGTGFVAPIQYNDPFKKDALGKNRAILERDKTLKTLDIGRVDFEDWNQRGADNPDNPLNDPNLLSVDRTQILDRFKTNKKLFATTFARYDPGNSPEQQKLKGSWMDNDIYMDAVPEPLPETTSTPPTISKVKATYVAPQLYQYGSWKKPTKTIKKKPYGGYVAPTDEIIPKRRGRTVQATRIAPPPGPFGVTLPPVVPVGATNQYPYSTPNLEGQPLPRFSVEDETRRLEALRTTPSYAFGGYTKRLHSMNDAMKKKAFGGYLPPFGDGNRFPKYKYREDREDTSYVDPIANPFSTSLTVNTPVGLTGGMPSITSRQTARVTGQPAPIRQRGLDIGDYKGDIAAGIGTIANQIQIGKLETDFNPELVDTPRNPYTDQREFLTNQANKQYTTAAQGIAGSSAQDNQALRANMYAKTLDNLSQSMGQEQQREDMFNLRHADTKSRTSMMNTQIKNQAKQLSMENRNQKRALTQANIDNLIRSYQGNEGVRAFTQTEHGKNLLAAIQSGDRGTSERLIASLSPKMRRQLGFEANGGIFKKGGIYIKPKNRGKFNALKKRTGKTTAELKRSKNPLTRKRATFAANAKKWKKK